MMKTAYIAGPIDFAGDPRAKWRGVREHLMSELMRQPGVAIFRPDQAWSVRIDPGEVDLRIEAVNRVALSEADVVVAFMPKDTVTVGTPREIEAAQQVGTPVCVVTDLFGSFALADVPQFPMTEDGAEQAAKWALAQDSFTEANRPAQLTFASFYPSGMDVPTVQLPDRTHHGDAGFDLYCSEETVVPVGQFRDIPCGVKVALPEGVWGRIVGRSSTLRKRSLMVNEGVIDSGYRGPLFAGVWNLGAEMVAVVPGERIAQFILHPNIAPSFRPVMVSRDEFDQIPNLDARGDNGFGSSGR